MYNVNQCVKCSGSGYVQEAPNARGIMKCPICHGHGTVSKVLKSTINDSDISDIRLSFELDGEYPTIIVTAILKDNRHYVVGHFANMSGTVSVKGLLGKIKDQDRINTRGSI